MIDLADGSIVEADLQALQQADDEARFVQYGKLEPQLHDRLEGMQDSETLEVAVWMCVRPKTMQELFAEVAELYPEAKEALEQRGRPFAVSDPDLSREIKQAYLDLAAEDTARFTQPLADDLESQGYQVTVFSGMPSLSAELPKWMILQLRDREDVCRIYLIGGVVEVEEE